jgi:hypothetical protein
MHKCSKPFKAMLTIEITGKTWRSLPAHIRQHIRWKTGGAWEEKTVLHKASGETFTLMRFELTEEEFEEIQEMAKKATPLPDAA